MGAIETLRDALFGNPPQPNYEPSREGVLAAFAELAGEVAGAANGILRFETTADRDAATGVEDGQLGYVYLNNGDPDDPDNNIYQYNEGTGTWTVALWYFEAVAAVVQPLVDQAEAAAAQAQAILDELTSDGSYLKGTLTIGAEYLDVFKTPSGRIIPRRGKDWIPVSHVGDGVYKPVSDGGIVTKSPGVVDGEAIRNFYKDENSGVVYGFGALGGVFTLVGNTLERANARFFAAKPNQTRFAGQTWTDGATQLLAKPADGRTAWIFVGMGQSNYDGENQNLSDPFMSTAAVYPNNALMLQGGPRIVSATGAATLVPLVENITNQGGGSDRQQETPTSGWVNHFIRDYFAAWTEYPTVVGMSVAIGGRSIVGNKLGTLAFQRLQTGMANAVAALRARGFTDIRTVIGWVGGESDTMLTGMNESVMRKTMQQLRRQASDVIRRITGEVTDPLFVMIQPSFVIPGGDPWNQPVRQAMVDLNGSDGFVNAGPAYQYAMTGSAVLADTHIHRNNLGKYSTGQQLARATMAEALGVAWKPLQPVRHYWAATPGGPVEIFGTRLTIEMNGMGSALVLDTSETMVKLAGLLNYGFIFDDGSGAAPAITAVSVSGMKVHIDLSFKPSGPDCKLVYAGARNADQYDADGPVYGARGCLRDNAAHVRISDNSNQYNWALGFVLRPARP